MRFLARFAAAALTVACLTPAAAAAAPAEEDTVFLLTCEPGSALNPALIHPQAEILYRYSLIDAVALSVPARAAGTAAEVFSRLSFVEDYAVSATFLAPAAEEEAAISAAPATDSHDLVLRSADETAGEGTLIAVIDTGFDVTHPAFLLPDGAREKITAESFDEAVSDTYAVFRLGRASVRDVYISSKIPFVFDYAGGDGDVAVAGAHGTHVAAIAAASDVAENALAGGAPGAQLALMKVFDDTGEQCREHSLILALEDAVRLGADIVNLSLGSLAVGGDSVSMKQLSRAIRAAESAGILVVCAIGNDGRLGAGGVDSDRPPLAVPDTGLPSEPAIDPAAFAVASATNAVRYADYIEAGGREIPYSPSYETAGEIADPLYKVLGGDTLRLTAVPGLGRVEDYGGISVREGIALVRRGEISFAEKVKNAADAGARAVILYDPAGDGEFLMQVGEDAPIPAVSVSRADGEYLATLDGERVTVGEAQGVFAETNPVGVASFSSWGPTVTLALKPDVTAVGAYVVSAVPGASYAVMSGTSMATPQISAAAAVCISENRAVFESFPAEERADVLRCALASLAVPMTDGDGLPLSPRAQGAGVIDGRNPLDTSLVMTSAEGAHSLSLGDKCDGTIEVAVTLHNFGDSARTVSLRMPVTTERAVEEDGVLRQSGLPESVPVTHSFVRTEGVTLSGGEILCTVPAGESVTVTLFAVADADAFAALKERAENGFFLEGYVIAEDTAGGHVASVPFLAFAGIWSEAPSLDVGDWDGHASIWGIQSVRDGGGSRTPLGETEDGALSALFAFSPNGDRSFDTVVLSLTPLRGIRELTVEVLDRDGNVVASREEVNILKTATTEGVHFSEISLWDGSDSMNPHFTWEDGQYTVRLTAYSYAGGVDTVEIPLSLDTTAPQLTETTLSGEGTLTATFTDDFYLREVRAYLPDPSAAPGASDAEKYKINETVTPVYDAETHTASVTVTLPTDRAYIYLSGEDYAGNRTVVRYYIENTKEVGA